MSPRRKTSILVPAACAILTAEAGAQLTLTGTSYSQNFDLISSGLPTGWTARTGATSSALGASAAFTTAATSWGDSAGAFKNLASATGLSSGDGTAIQAAATDRAFGVRQTAGFGDPGASFSLQLANTIGFSSFALSLSAEMLSVQPRSTTWTLEYGVGATPTSFTALATYVDPAVFGTTAISVSGAALNPIANQSGNVWLRVVALTGATGSGNRDTFAIDDFSLTWTSVAPPATVTWNVTGNGAWDVSSNNWTGGSPDASKYKAGDTAVFSDGPGGPFTGTREITVSIAGANPGATSVTNTDGTYRFINGSIGGGGYTKTGAGTAQFAQTNSFSSVALNGGVTETQVNGALGSAAIAINGGTWRTSSVSQSYANTATVTGTGTIDTATNLTLSAAGNAVTGSASDTLVKTGTEQLIFPGTGNGGLNAFNGLIDVRGGTLSNRRTSGGFIPSGGTLNVAAGAFYDETWGDGEGIGRLTGAGTVVGRNGVNAAGSSAIFVDVGSTDVEFSGLITMGTDGVIGVTNATRVGAFAKGGTGILTLSGTSSDYAGLTAAQSGTLSIASVADKGTVSSIGVGNFGTGSDIILGAASAAGALRYTGATASTDRTVALDAGDGIVDVTTAGTTLTLSGVISNLSGTADRQLFKTGPGMLLLSGTSTWDGGIEISNGTVSIASINNFGLPGTLGEGSSTDDIYLGTTGGSPTAGALLYTGPGASTDRYFRIRGGGGTIDVATAGTELTLASTGFVRSETGTTGPFNKAGPGTLIVASNPSYAGTTTIHAGTLRLNGTHTGGGAYTVKLGGTLGGTGTTASAVTVESGGTLAPGAGIGSFTVGSLTLDPGATFAMEVNAGTGVEAADKTVVTAGGVTLGDGSSFPTLSFIFSPAFAATFGTPPAGKTFIVIQKNSAGAVTAGSQFAGAPDDTLVIDGLLKYTLDYNYTGSAFNGTGDGNDVAVTFHEVPEPGTGAVLLAGALLGLRRRRA